MEIKVKEYDAGPQKSKAQVEEELLQKHETEVSGGTAEETKVEAVKVEATGQTEEPTKTEETVKEEPVVEEKPQMGEQEVLSFIREKYSKEVESIDDLFTKREQEELPSDVATYLQYKKDTGRGFEDFAKISRDYSKESPDQVLSMYYAEMEEGLDRDEIDYLLNSKFGTDPEVDSEDDIKKKNIDKKKELAKALKYFEGQKEKYKVPVESMGTKISDEDQQMLKAYQEQVEKSKEAQSLAQKRAESFQENTNKLFTEEFKGFKFNISDKEYVYSPGDFNELKKSQSDIMNFISKFTNDQGEISDVVGYHKSLAMAMNPEKFAKYFYEQGVASAVNESAKKSKNINLDMRQTPQVTSKQGFSVKATTPSSRRGLTIRSPKNK